MGNAVGQYPTRPTKKKKNSMERPLQEMLLDRFPLDLLSVSVSKDGCDYFLNDVSRFRFRKLHGLALQSSGTVATWAPVKASRTLRTLS